MTETEYLLNVAFKQIKNRQFANSNIVPFMESVLDNFYSSEYRQSSHRLVADMEDLPFVEVSFSTQLEAPCNLFDPDILTLKQLFLGECKFPASSFSSQLAILRQCGLKVSVDAKEIFQIMLSVRVTVHRQKKMVAVDENSYLRLVAVLKYLSDNPSLLNTKLKACDTLLTVLRKQAEHYCWLPIASSPPSQYPSCLVWKGSQYPLHFASFSANPLIILLSQDLATTQQVDLQVPHNLIVGSEAVFIENFPSQLEHHFCCSTKKLVFAVISHFKHVIKNKDSMPDNMLQIISIKTYEFLQNNIQFCNMTQLSSSKWLWVESLSIFIDSRQAAIAANPSFLLNLEPFIFVLSSNLKAFSTLFLRCGVPCNVTTEQILSVLQSVRDSSQLSDDEAWSKVRAVLDWIADNPDAISKDNILVPVESDLSYPQLIPIDDVAYTDNEMLRGIARMSNEKYNLIHPKMSYLSSKLGLSPLSDQLDITEDVFEDAGQHEPLATRLSNILSEYKDGLTIIKEMIQMLMMLEQLKLIFYMILALIQATI